MCKQKQTGLRRSLSQVLGRMPWNCIQLDLRFISFSWHSYWSLGDELHASPLKGGWTWCGGILLVVIHQLVMPSSDYESYVWFLVKIWCLFICKLERFYWKRFEWEVEPDFIAFYCIITVFQLGLCPIVYFGIFLNQEIFLPSVYCKMVLLLLFPRF